MLSTFMHVARQYSTALLYVLSIGFLAIVTEPAVAQQTIRQSGNITPGHPVKWTAPGVVSDGGSAAQGSLTGVGVTASGPSICSNSGPITGAFNRLCIGATATAGIISLDNIGGATGGFTLRLNGVTQGIATVTLPVTAGDSACFADSTGTLQDCGGAPVVLTCASVGAVPVWDGLVWDCSNAASSAVAQLGVISVGGGTSQNQIYSNSTATPIVIGTSSTPSGVASNPTLWVQQVPNASEQDAAIWVARYGGVQTGASVRCSTGGGTVTAPLAPAVGSLLCEWPRFDSIGTSTGIAGGASNGSITLALLEAHSAGVIPNAQAGGGGQVNFRQGAGKEATVTMTIATPAVVTWSDHGLIAGNTIVFRTTGALPTGVTAGTTYYVLATDLTSSTFKFSTSDGGSAVNTSGSQSGTHTGMAFKTATTRTFELQAPTINDTHYQSWNTAQAGGNITLTVKTDATTADVGMNIVADDAGSFTWMNGSSLPLFKITGSAATIANYWAAAGNTTGNTPSLQATGEANIGGTIQSSGTGSIFIARGTGNAIITEFIGNVSSPVNYLQISPAATSTRPLITTAGEVDTGISIRSGGQGSVGSIKIENDNALAIAEFVPVDAATTGWIFTSGASASTIIQAGGSDTNVTGVIKPKGAGTIIVQNGGGDNVGQFAATTGSRYLIFTADNTNPSITPSAGSLSLNGLIVGGSNTVTTGVWNAGAVTSSGAVTAAAASGFVLGAVTVLVSSGSPSANFIKVQNSGSGPNMAVGNASDQRIINTANAGVQYNSDTGFNVFLTNGTGQYFGSTSTQTRIYATTAATSTTDGALRSSGGLSVSGAGWFGTYVATGVVAVGSLPACGAGIKGARMFVTDATATTFASTVAAGGANNVPVVCDGTNWIIGKADVLDLPKFAANDNVFMEKAA